MKVSISRFDFHSLLGLSWAVNLYYGVTMTPWNVKLATKMCSCAKAENVGT